MSAITNWLIKYLTLIGISLALFTPVFAKSPVSPVPVPEPPPVEPVKEVVIAPTRPIYHSKEAFVEYARNEAVKANLSPQRVYQVINCETAGTWDPMIQSEAYNKKDGGRELSFGLAQIHMPAHSDITMEQATDPYWAIDFLISEWKQDRAWQWTCYTNPPL